MEENSPVGVVVLVSLILTVASLGYIAQFSDTFGNEYAINPSGSEGGLQLSPTEIQVVCKEGKFSGCLVQGSDFLCGLNARGFVEGGREARVGVTLCEFVENCAC